ncbi:hypothetical protein C8J57DRAFT_1527642 [Mycena rebaudengoi]|nr:hypothetical protein C8J57DRAFT_1527642 [Mycena rebaudengoi]
MPPHAAAVTLRQCAAATALSPCPGGWSGIMREFHAHRVQCIRGVGFDYKTGEGITQHWSTPNAVENPGLFVHRSDLYEELKRLATGDGEGPPAKLCLGSKVLACDPEEGTITLNTGEVVQADLILGADGKNASLMFSSMCH